MPISLRQVPPPRFRTAVGRSPRRFRPPYAARAERRLCRGAGATGWSSTPTASISATSLSSPASSRASRRHCCCLAPAAGASFVTGNESESYAAIAALAGLEVLLAPVAEPDGAGSHRRPRLADVLARRRHPARRLRRPGRLEYLEPFEDGTTAPPSSFRGRHRAISSSASSAAGGGSSMRRPC